MNHDGPAATAAEPLRFEEPAGRWVLAATVLGSGIAFMTGTVVNVALPDIGRSLDADVAGLQWVVNSYLITLAALILLGGTLGDRYGRRRVFAAGIAGFGVTSLLCALAPTLELLVVARAAQGATAAMLVPGSLAIIQASFHPQDRARAIGAWSALSGVGAAVGPIVGGWLIDVAGWRAVFWMLVPIALVVAVVAQRKVPESRDPTAPGDLDWSGAALGVVALAAVSYALLQAKATGGSPTLVGGAAVLGVVALVAFVVVERRREHPMLPPDIFASSQFRAANAVTLVVYAALGGVFFLLVVHLQTSLGYSALAAGAATLPITGLLLLLSARAGALAQRIGPRRPLTVGPALLAVGMGLMATIGPGDSYLLGVLPSVTVFGLGLAATVAPVTATALAAVGDEHAGLASGVNNAVARTAQLLAVAILPLVAGIDGDSYADPDRFTPAFATAMQVAAGLAVVGAVLGWTTIRDDVLADGRRRPAAPSQTGPASVPSEDPEEAP